MSLASAWYIFDRAGLMMTCESRAEVKILVPGAGLARLAWEVVRMGEWCSRRREREADLTRPRNRLLDASQRVLALHGKSLHFA